MMNTFAWTFQGGKIRIIKSLVSVAGNVATTIRPEQGKRWIVMSLRLHIVADANAANRIARPTITDGTSTMLQLIENTAAIVANETKDVEWLSGQSYGESDGVGGNLLMVGTFPNVLLDYYSSLRLILTIVNGLAGDTYDYYLTVLEVEI